MIDGLTWQHPQLIHLVWVVLAVIGALIYLELRSSAALGRFLSAVMQRRLAERQSRGLKIARLGLAAGALTFGVLALMRPQTPGGSEPIDPDQATADIVFAVDVSRSMLADDAAPTRLARARAEIASLAEELDGNRLGLVAFAGRASVMCALTTDISFFRMVLRDLDTRSVTRGGTNIGGAIRTATRAFPPGLGAKLLVLITDGEDHESMPLDAARAAAELGVRIVSIGFGSEEGSEITLVDPDTGAKQLLTDRDGKTVVSRLDGDLLRQIALETKGAYIPAGTAAIDLESIVREHIEPIARDASELGTRRVPAEQYPWLVLASLGCLFAAVLIGASGARRWSL